MARDWPTLTEDTPISDIVLSLQHLQVDDLPVLRQAYLIGMVNRRRLVQVVARRLAAGRQAPSEQQIWQAMRAGPAGRPTAAGSHRA